MKTFKQLSLGDSVYYTTHPSDLLKSDTSIIYSFIVDSIRIGKESGTIYLNERRTYNGSTIYDLEVPIISHDKNAMRAKEYQYKIYFTDKSTANSWIRQMALEAIKQAENYITSTIKNKTNEVYALREKYHEVLNSSFYPNFDISELPKTTP